MKGKTIFWNVDTQYDFMRDDESYKGKLPVPGARGIEGNLEFLTGLAKERRIVVVNTGDWHTMESPEISDKPDFITTFPPHCLIGTNGADFVPATNPENPYIIDWREGSFDSNEVLSRRNIVLYKDKFGVFEGTKHADRVVELLKPERAIVYGVATNVCVDQAVRGLLERKVEVYVPIDAIKELPKIPLPYGDWEKKGAVLTTTKEVAKYL